MKLRIAFSILSVAFMVCACDSPPQQKNADQNTSQNDQTKPGNTNKGYRFNSASEKCDTFQRQFSTQVEMCLGLEIDASNNNCALSERQSYYQANCKGMTTWYPTWRPDLAELELKNTNGSYVTCSLQEKDVPEITQFSSAHVMNMEGVASKATISHVVKNGRVSLELYLYSTLTNTPIGHITAVTQDSVQPAVLSVPAAVGSPVLTCVVTISQKP